MNTFVRRALAASVTGVCLAALGTVGVPAAVAAIQQAQIDATAQNFDVSASFTGVALDQLPKRDDFEVTHFTLVQWPVGSGSPISSYFGGRSCEACSSFHHGIDFTPGAGTPIEAIADGVVVQQVGSLSGLGVTVAIDHVIDGVAYRSSYSHMQSGSLTVSPGDVVTRGQVIGRVGATGLTSGAHLHFTLQDAAGTYFNPLPSMRDHVNIDD